MSIPSFIKELPEFREVDWITEHDCLLDGYENPFDNKNQIDWWKMNVSIRKAFILIEEEIKSLNKKKKKINKRVLTWSKIAILAKCDRNTLRHPRRAVWTEEKFAFLSKMIENINQPGYENGCDVQGLKEKVIQDLELDLIKAQNETAKWVGKFKMLEDEVKVLKRALKHKDFEIFAKDRKIGELRSKVNNS